MRAILLTGLLIIFASGLLALGGYGDSAAGTLDTVHPTLTLTSPNGGEEWYIGDSQAITWTATDTHLPATPIMLSYSVNGGADYLSLSDDYANSGSYTWQLPSIQSYNARVRIRVSDSFGNATQVSSASAFSITYVPPAAPQGLSVDITGGIDAVLSWQPVTQTIYSTPITPDGYIVLYNETPYTTDQFYYYLWDVTSGTAFTHGGVARRRQQMYYQVVAYKDYRGAIANLLQSLHRADAPRISLAQIKAAFQTSASGLLPTGNTDLQDTCNTDLQSVMWGDLQSPPQNPVWTSNSHRTNPNRINAELQTPRDAELPAGNSTRPRVQGIDTIGGGK